MAKKAPKLSPADELSEAKFEEATLVEENQPHPNCILKSLRIARGLTLSDVGTNCKMSQSGVLRVERGGELHLTHAINLAKFFGQTIEQIWQTN